MTPEQVLTERSKIAELIVEHLDHWNKLKLAQTGRTDDFSGSGIFNILDMLDSSAVQEAISIYKHVYKV